MQHRVFVHCFTEFTIYERGCLLYCFLFHWVELKLTKLYNTLRETIHFVHDVTLFVAIHSQEDTKGVIRNRKSKMDRQHNGQKKKDKQQSTKILKNKNLKIEHLEPH